MLRIPDGVEFLAFADNVTMVATAKETHTLEDMLTTVAGKVSSWLTDIGPKLAANMSEAAVISNECKNNDITILVDGTWIQAGKIVKYLGIQIR